MMTAQGRGAISRMVHNSVHLRQMFNMYVKQHSNGVVNSACTNMRAAKHRFESFQKPIGRTCLHLHACIRTALHIWLHSNNPDAKDRAKKWLLWINCERCLMAAMMADASDQAMALTRSMDTEKLDPASLNAEIHAFNLSITALFCENQCLVVFGYTSTMLALLKKQLVWQVGNETCVLGDESGVRDDVIERCLGRMRSWIILARASLRAEFPSWEISQARGGRKIP
eukprot:7511179-Pyramimonas_sp.AAC.2